MKDNIPLYAVLAFITAIVCIPITVKSGYSDILWLKELSSFLLGMLVAWAITVVIETISRN